MRILAGDAPQIFFFQLTLDIILRPRHLHGTPILQSALFWVLHLEMLIFLLTLKTISAGVSIACFFIQL